MLMNPKQVFLFFWITFIPFASMSQFEPEKMKGGLFVENKGQWNENVLYKSDIPSGQLYIEKNRFLFNFYDQEAMGTHHHGLGDNKSNDIENNKTNTRLVNNKPKPTLIKAHSYEVAFVGCSPISSTEGVDPTSYSRNYFKGSNKLEWASGAKSYAKTILHDIYPNTSLASIAQETGFKYEFYLNPGANASLIKLKYAGVDTIFLKHGELFIQTSVNSFYEQRPYSYQEINGQRILIPCEFKLENNVLSFNFPKGYNKRFPLVIDPQLIFSTYSGSTADNWGNSATYDDDGNTYMVGIAFEQGYPATLGAYQIQYNGFEESFPLGDGFYPKFDPDVAIMKFDPLGKLLYATYLGGTESEVPSSCIVNSKKELIIFGFTGSDGALASNGSVGLPFPTTTGAYDVSFNGGSPTAPMSIYDAIFFDRGTDLFVSTLSANGNSLISSTLIGGSENDGITNIGDALSRNYGDQFRGEIYCDGSDQIYIITKTFSSDIVNIAAPGYDKTFNGLTDAYLCKLSGDLKTMLWDTYIGGSNHDVGYSIRVASDNTVYITGGTLSSNFPTSVGAIKTSMSFGDIDGYIAHLSADGTSLLQATYIGTSSYDQCFFIQLDKSENVFVFGQTLGDFPMSDDVYGQVSTGQFLQKIDPTLSTVLLSTTFGNKQNAISIVPTAFLVNNCDNILLAGWGGNVNSYLGKYIGGTTKGLQTTSNAFSQLTDGSDFYLMVLEKDFKSLLYGTFFGGYGEDDHVDGGTSRFDKNGIVYQSVCGSCGGTSRFPVTSNAHSDTNNSSNCNNACFKFDLSNLRADFTANPITTCLGSDSITFTNTSTGGVSFEWDMGDGTKLSGNGPFQHNYRKPGTYLAKLIATDLTTCTGKDTAEKTITILPLPSIGGNLTDTTICLGDTLQILNSCNPTYTYSWSPNISISNTEICDAKFFPKEARSYYLRVVDENGCVYLDTITFKVATLAKGVNWENMTPCNGKPTARLSNPSTGPLNYLWTFGDGSSSASSSPIHEYSKGGVYPIVLNLYNEYCSATEVGTVKIDEILIPNLFTPNDDGKNDCFEIKGLYPGWKVEVYNPWNSLVFKSDSYQNQFCGEGISTSVYYYLVCAPYGACCKSWVHVISDK